MIAITWLNKNKDVFDISGTLFNLTIKFHLTNFILCIEIHNITQRNRDPLPKRPISVEWNGSKISIYDVEGIIQDASSNQTAIYGRGGWR